MKLKSVLIIIIFFVLLVIFTSTSFADEADYLSSVISSENVDAFAVSDSDYSTFISLDNDSIFSVRNSEGLKGIYIVFDKIPSSYSLSFQNREITLGENGFLHEYIDLAEYFSDDIYEVDLKFPSGTSIADIYAFSSGDIPSWVQKWEKPCKKADLLLVSSHSDDEQLFFAGIIPFYSVEKKLKVQVVYLVSHFDTHERPHEQLNGLWTVGDRYYPLISDFPDLYSESLDEAVNVYDSNGVSRTDIKNYLKNALIMFSPRVLVTHDEKGEYGHGTHILCTDIIKEIISDESFSEYLPQKVYFHLYGENKIHMNWDDPLDSLNGKTPFEVTQDGFACHKSQHWTWFYGWIYGDDGNLSKAADIKTYSPCEYGLYYSAVGSDIECNDFFENIDLSDDVHETEVQNTANDILDTNSDPVTSVIDNPVEDNFSGTIVLLIVFAVIIFAVCMIFFIKFRRR